MGTPLGAVSQEPIQITQVIVDAPSRGRADAAALEAWTAKHCVDHE